MVAAMLGKPKYHSQFYQLLLQALGDAHVSIREIDRITYARDCNFQSTGSGVGGGTLPTKGGVIMDMKRNREFLELNKREGWVCVETGLNGEQLERFLNRKGYTLGHFPSSIYCSTVGGWLAARSAGQCSSRYGKIEDMVIALEVVVPTGEIITTSYVKNKADVMDWNQLFIGTEGTLGTITKAWLRVHSLPEKQLFRGVVFPTLERGIAAMREVMQQGLQPAVLRLYDPLDTHMFFGSYQPAGSPSVLERLKSMIAATVGSMVEGAKAWGLRRALTLPGFANYLPSLVQDKVLLIVGCEGIDTVAELEMQAILKIATDFDGEDAGVALGEHWYQHRYSMAYKASPIFHQGAFVDTVEVATTWDHLDQLYATVKSAIEPHALVMAHLSHAYHDGCAIYFTFIAYESTASKSEALFETIWHQALSACQRAGGVISHHHGIGRLKVEFMREEWNEGIELLRGFKRVWDRAYLMNPGKLIPFRE